MLLGDLGDGVDVGDVRVGVAERLEIDDRGVVLDGTLNLFQVVGIDKRGLDAKLGERMLEQVVGTAVDGLLSTTWSPAGQELQGIGDGSGTGGDGKTGHAPSSAAIRSSKTPGWSWSDGRRCYRVGKTKRSAACWELRNT